LVAGPNSKGLTVKPRHNQRETYFELGSKHRLAFDGYFGAVKVRDPARDRETEAAAFDVAARWVSSIKAIKDIGKMCRVDAYACIGYG